MHPMVNIALRAARKAGEQIVRASEDMNKVGYEEKARNDYVSDVDRTAEKEIVYQLQKAYPEHHILCEEQGMLPGRDPMSVYRWIIDPLDGTTNFLRGIPHYAISIGLELNGKMEVAVIYDPVRREEYTASRGNGAQLNGRRIRVSERSSLDGAVIGTGLPFRHEQAEYLEQYFANLKTLSMETAGIRRAGSAALDLAYVAAGRFDAFWEYGLQPWDIAAGSLLIREAGGMISDPSGNPNIMESGDIVCGNPRCFKALLKKLSS